jgi:hypothetical protein
MVSLTPVLRYDRVGRHTGRFGDQQLGVRYPGVAARLYRKRTQTGEEVQKGADYCHRFVPFWTRLFVSISMLFLLLLYRHGSVMAVGRTRLLLHDTKKEKVWSCTVLKKEFAYGYDKIRFVHDHVLEYFSFRGDGFGGRA